MQLRKFSVMIVDDHPEVRRTWKLLLEKSGEVETVLECQSGADAISLVDELHFDIILMDINMSPANGFEATRKILKKKPRQRIIGISVNNQPGYARNIMQLGARGYVTKNSSREEMLQAMKLVMEGRTYICAEVWQRMQDPNKDQPV